MATTLEQAEALKGKTLLKNEKFIVEQFGNDEKFDISLDHRGHICAHMKEKYRNTKNK